ncbi:MAG: NUDIX domain-containing protein [Nanoarchaeota archaeon]|nr:NUDIX domain-containing protein [Nanoarchaeota archaeon]
MKYNLNSPKRKRIFQQFVYRNELRFNEMEKLTGMRSNDLAYFIQKLVDEGLLVKDRESYRLSAQAEKYIPFFIESDDEMSPLPVVLVACVKDGNVLLWKRKKRPYQGKWSLPGGRIRLKETVAEASMRVLKSGTFIDARFESANAVLNEKLVQDGRIKYGFIIIFTRASPLSEIKDKEDVRWFKMSDLPPDMIPSDRWLVQNRHEAVIELKEDKIIAGAEELGMEFD